jgi:hypothetical protein
VNEADGKRQPPIVLESQAWRETVRVKLPAGFAVDELPEAAERNQPFGNYAAKFEVQDGHLVFRRTLVLNGEEWIELRKSASLELHPAPRKSSVRISFRRIAKNSETLFQSLSHPDRTRQRPQSFLRQPKLPQRSRALAWGRRPGTNGGAGRAQPFGENQ